MTTPSPSPVIPFLAPPPRGDAALHVAELARRQFVRPEAQPAIRPYTVASFLAGEIGGGRRANASRFREPDVARHRLVTAGIANDNLIVSPALWRWFHNPLRLDPPQHALGQFPKPYRFTDTPVTSVFVATARHAQRLAWSSDCDERTGGKEPFKSGKERDG